MLIDSPHGVIGHLNEFDQYIELWRMDDPEDSYGVGACLDSDDRDELFATGTADINATATDLFDGELRPAAIDHLRGSAALTGADGRDYHYSFSWCSILPLTGAPGAALRGGSLCAVRALSGEALPGRRRGSSTTSRRG